MFIKQFLRTRVNVLAKPFKAVILAVLPAGAALELVMEASSKEKNTKEAPKTIQEEVVDSFDQSMDHSMDATDKVLRWQSEVVKEIIEPTVDTDVPIEIEQPAIVDVASEAIRTDEQIEKLRISYLRAIVEGPTGTIFNSITGASNLNPPIHSNANVPAYTPPSPTSLCDSSASAIASTFTPSLLASPSYSTFKAESEYHFNLVAEYLEDQDARTGLHGFMRPIYFPNRE